MSSAIGAQVIWTLHAEEGEPVDELRARLAEQRARKQALEAHAQQRVDYANTPVTYAQMMQGMPGGGIDELLNNHATGVW